MTRSVPLAALALLLLPVQAFALDCPAEQPASNEVTTLDSEFARTGSADPANWQPVSGLHGDVHRELEAFAPSEVTAAPGTGLALNTEDADYLGHPYKSGEVTTQGRFAQTYGHFEIMAKVPLANGMWPAIWLLPENGAWPPEIDILEYIFAPWGKPPSRATGAASQAQTTLHRVGLNGQDAATGQGYNSNIPLFRTYEDWSSTPPPPGWSSAYAGYHVYAVDWRPQAITWYIDGTAVFCAKDDGGPGQHIPDLPMYLILNDSIAAGDAAHPGWPGYLADDQAFPLTMNVAYARVSQFKDVASPPPVLDIRNISISNSHPKPGQIVHLYAEIHVGAEDLGIAESPVFTIRAADVTAYTGIGPVVGTAQFPVSKLEANRTYRVKAAYLVPDWMTPGIYSVGAKLGYGFGPENGAGGGHHAEIPQGTLMTIGSGEGE